MKNVPNMITGMRIMMAISLIFLTPNTYFFLVLYLLCGLSDILDGFLARKYKLQSPLGATFDSIADVIFFGVTVFVYLPIIRLPQTILLWILLIFIIRLISILIVGIKYHTFAILHTYLNKATGFALFCFPILIYVLGVTLSGYLLCGIASISAIEELLIQITSKKLQRDIKSIFSGAQ
jgi:CDP-diacylglycerol--glycerol-3-phosphate 3-phosphatidyltransferase